MCMRACMDVCVRSQHAFQRACARALVHECACVWRERRERRRNTAVRRVDVCHHVCIHMCECMYMHMCACRSHASVCACACVRASARRERRTRAPTRRVPLRAHICVRMYECMYMSVYECANLLHGSVRMCACARARGCGVPIRTVCACIDACASRNVRMPRCAHTHARTHTHLRLSAAQLLVYARMGVYACVYRWLGIDRCASVCMYMYIRIYI
jgi:hypothetical protein